MRAAAVSLVVAALGLAANLEAMGKTDEALARYRDIAKTYAHTFAGPIALSSQVPILKAKGQIEEARVVDETIINQYQSSVWAMQAMQELRTLKVSQGATPPGGAKPPLPLPPIAAPPSLPGPAPVPPNPNAPKPGQSAKP